MKASSRLCLAAALRQLLRRADGEHLAGIHQRNAVATLRFVHEVGGEEDRHAFVAGQADQEFARRSRGRPDRRPRWARRESALRAVHERRRPAAGAGSDPRGRLSGRLSATSLQIEPLEHLLNASRSAVLRQVEQLGVELEVLPDGQFAVERERLRHVADPLACRHVAGVDRLAEQSASPSVAAAGR